MTQGLDRAGVPLRSIVDAFVHDDPSCTCRGGGVVCATHPSVPWGDGDGCCGAEGMPCPRRPGVVVHLWNIANPESLACCGRNHQDLDAFADQIVGDAAFVTCPRRLAITTDDELGVPV